MENLKAVTQLRYEDQNDDYSTVDYVQWSAADGILTYVERDGNQVFIPINTLKWWEVGGPDEKKEEQPEIVATTEALPAKAPFPFLLCVAVILILAWILYTWFTGRPTDPINPVFYGGLGGLGMPELLVIVVIAVLLFGGKRIPELAKGIGTAFRELKGGLREAADVEHEVKKP